MKPETISILTSINLTAEQWQGVMQAFALETFGAEQRVRSSGAIRQERYRNKKRNESVTCDVTGDVTTVTDGAKESFPHTPFKENNNLTVINNTPLVPPSPSQPTRFDPDGFAEFWAAYPKRDGNADRKGASKAFAAASKRVGSEAILIGARHYAEHCHDRGKTGTEFVKQARSWLNAEMWTEWQQKPSQANGNTYATRSKPNTIADGFELLNAAIAEREAELDRLESLHGFGGEGAKLLS